MSEDKMREKFENLVANYPYKRPVDRNGMGYVNDSVFLAYESWKACTAIKDAEIAARDLMIKELRKSVELACVGACNCLTKTPDYRYHKSACTYGILQQALAKSEHHNSKALDNMLLEAELKGLKNAYAWNPLERGMDTHLKSLMWDCEVKLAELNKE